MILIVDDKEENIFSLKKLLESNRFPVDTALSGEEALKKALHNNYFLIILDVQMPEMDGFEVAEVLMGLDRTRDIPIIFLSAVNTDTKFITKGYESGGIDYVTKPVDPEILLLKIRTFYRLYEQTISLKLTENALRREIESRQKAQQSLKKEIDNLHLTLESLPQIAFTANWKGELEFVNSKWLRFAPSETVFPETHPSEPAIYDSWLPYLNNALSYEQELRIKELAADSYKYHLLRIAPICDQNNNQKWVGTFTDIDDRKQIEQKKDDFLSITSHELKTPLTSIKGYTQIAIRQITENECSHALKCLHLVDNNIDRLQNLISELLDISKIENGQMQFTSEDFELEGLIQQTAETILETQYSKECKVELIIRTSRRMIKGDKARIEQVLINYLTNAVKYSPDNPRIVIESEYVDGPSVKVSVTDNGIGIPEHNHKEIFSKFYRVQESSANYQGLGIGLFICAEIIKQHQGTVGLTSVPSGGSTFYFTLPLN